MAIIQFILSSFSMGLLLQFVSSMVKNIIYVFFFKYFSFHWVRPYSLQHFIGYHTADAGNRELRPLSSSYDNTSVVLEGRGLSHGKTNLCLVSVLFLWYRLLWCEFPVYANNMNCICLLIRVFVVISLWSEMSSKTITLLFLFWVDCCCS